MSNKAQSHLGGIQWICQSTASRFESRFYRGGDFLALPLMHPTRSLLNKWQLALLYFAHSFTSA